MKKNEFLRELENSLKGKLSEIDINEILSDYNDIFEEGLWENRDEDEISESIGSPAAISKAIIDDSTAHTPRDINIPVLPDISNLAPMSKRFLAYLIDTVVIILVFILIVMIPGATFLQTSTSSSTSPQHGSKHYKQRLYLDKNKGVKKVKFYEDDKKVFSDHMGEFKDYMEENNIHHDSIQTVETFTPFFSKSRSRGSHRVGDPIYSYSYSLSDPGSLSAIMPLILFFPYLLIIMALGFTNVITAFELWLFRGYTLGKWITKTRVVRTDDNKITFWDAFVRDFLLKFGASALVGGVLNVVSFIMASVTAEHKTIHDLAAKTKVINIER